MSRCRCSERIESDDDRFDYENPQQLHAAIDMTVNEALDYAVLKPIVCNWGTETLFLLTYFSPTMMDGRDGMCGLLLMHNQLCRNITEDHNH
jgi:hypothetical protein